MAAKEELKLYNSLTRQKEIFKPLVPGKVSMYVCGITAYDYSHLGHARAAVSFDVLYRYLKFLGYEVTYVRNFTDIDDKIIRRANETKEDPLNLSNRFCQEYITDMDDLQCLRPTHEPRVSDHMEQIKDMITQIINNGCAYTVDGDVFFAVERATDYGQLSRRRLEDNRAGERIAVDSRKRNPADFALWKAAKPDEPSWESPWGPGRPGWHIECSAMSAHYLTYKFDIHGGGNDLMFPHHENEIAQSCAACRESHVSYWLHNGHVTNNNEKMSKSLGNFFTIREITERYHPLALRHFLMSAHYQSPLSYSFMQLESSSEAVFYIYQTLQDCEDALSLPQETSVKDNKGNAKPAQITPDPQVCISKLRGDVQSKLSDDLNTSEILTGAFQEALECMNSLKKEMQEQQELSIIQSLVELEKEVKEVLGVMGLLAPLAYSKVLQQLKDKALKRAGLKEEDITLLIEERAQARAQSRRELKQLKDEALKRTGLEEKDITLLIKERAQARRDLKQLKDLKRAGLKEEAITLLIGKRAQARGDLKQKKDEALKRAVLKEEDITPLIEEIEQAMEAFARSDNVRADLAAKGIALMDDGKETIWRPCVPVEQDLPVST